MPLTALSANSTIQRKNQGSWRSQEITQTEAYTLPPQKKENERKRKTKQVV